MAAKVQHFAHKTKTNHEKLVQIGSFCFILIHFPPF
jgi:hypothetical protein